MGILQMALSYHEKTEQLVNRSLVVAPEVIETLEGRERVLGIRLPPSVREWYSLEGSVEILAACSNMDHPVPLAQLGEPEHDWHGWGPQDLLSESLLIVMDENQHVAQWAVYLDGSNDPPVLVREAGLGPRPDWRHYADTFSDFVYTQVWDWTGPGGDLLGEDIRCLLGAQCRQLSQSDLVVLRRQLREEPITYGWPGRVTYRFTADRGRARICDQEGRADWQLWADTRDDLASIATRVSACVGPASRFFVWEPLDGCAQEVLADLRT